MTEIPSSTHSLPQISSTAIEQVDRDSNLVKHAEREMRLLGCNEGDIQWMRRVVSVFASYGHSGGSAMYYIPMLQEILQFHTLSALTANPGEWTEVGPNVWQNKRNPEVFSTDGGKTHYYISDKFRTIHESQERP